METQMNLTKLLSLTALLLGLFSFSVFAEEKPLKTFDIKVSKSKELYDYLTDIEETVTTKVLEDPKGCLFCGLSDTPYVQTHRKHTSTPSSAIDCFYQQSGRGKKLYEKENYLCFVRVKQPESIKTNILDLIEFENVKLNKDGSMEFNTRDLLLKKQADFEKRLSDVNDDLSKN